MDRPGGPSLAFRFDLARKAFAHTAAYDAAIASTLEQVSESDGVLARRADQAMPSRLTLGLEKLRDLRYGENPHQPAAWYAPAERAGLGAAAVLQGKELSYTNLLDLDAAARIVLEFAEPAAAVVKHTNPCGVATGAHAADAYVRAREADALSAFGGIVALNRTIDAEAARAIASTRIDAVIAPAVHAEARDALARKPQMRVVTADFSQLAAGADLDVRSILGAVLVQERDRVVEAAGLLAHGGPARGHQAVADGRGVAGAPVCLAGDGAREVEYRNLHARRPHRGHRRRADEPRGRRAGGAAEGAVDRARRVARHGGGFRRVLSRSATAWTRLRRPAPPPWCSRADR